MRTKISLALGPRRPLSRQTAWGCLTTNLALPGLGSLAAGRRVGYFQALLGFTGLGFTLLFGVRFFYWYLTTSSRMQSESDPLQYLWETWLAVRWALFGMGLFAAGWVWALITSSGILAEAKRAEPPPLKQAG